MCAPELVQNKNHIIPRNDLRPSARNMQIHVAVGDSAA